MKGVTTRLLVGLGSALAACCVQAAAVGDRVGTMTVMSVRAGDGRSAVLEDFSRRDGPLTFVGDDGHVESFWPKTLESSADETGGRFLGHSTAEIRASSVDLLARELLAKPGDPRYDDVAHAFPPIRKMRWGTHDFVGTPDSIDKVGFNIGGRSPSFDPAIEQPSIRAIVDSGNVWHGLVGGHLPVIRFVYPEPGGKAWTELIAFAPRRMANHNPRVQPVWYRVTRVEDGQWRWSRYIDTYQAFPPRTHDDGDDARRFYEDLARLRSDWMRELSQGMQIDIPDARIADIARLSLVRAMMTRTAGFPKYGVVDKDYGGSEHDGFPDTFNVEASALIDWGLLDQAGRVIDNYFSFYVRDDGSLMYRGPETGQYGRMLTVLAQFVSHGGDAQLLVKHRSRIDAIARLLLALRHKALERPRDDASFGMLSGWSEADSVLDPEPSRYVQPYLSNSAEAARGFDELGRVYQRLAKSANDAPLASWGRQLLDEAASLRSDLQRAIARSTLVEGAERVIPAIAGVREPFHRAVARDKFDPQMRSYRAYMELMHSGLLTADQIASIADYRERHRDILLGLPTAYGVATQEVAGFLAYGHGFGLLQADRIREALLLLYSDVAHQYTRGSWTAPETRRPLLPNEETAPYCVPAQLVASLVTRWLLVFEAPDTGVVWIGKGVPRDWLKEGRSVAVRQASTTHGRIDFALRPKWSESRIDVQLKLPDQAAFDAPIHVRLRAPDGKRLRAVRVDGQPWSDFNIEGEYIRLPSGWSGAHTVVARY